MLPEGNWIWKRYDLDEVSRKNCLTRNLIIYAILIQLYTNTQNALHKLCQTSGVIFILKLRYQHYVWLSTVTSLRAILCFKILDDADDISSDKPPPRPPSPLANTTPSQFCFYTRRNVPTEGWRSCWTVISGTQLILYKYNQNWRLSLPRCNITT